MSTEKIAAAINTSALGKPMPLNLISVITDYLEIRDILFCSHKGSDLRAYSIYGDYLGTMAKTIDSEDDDHDQWITGFDFDSNGAVYIAMYEGFLSKYPYPSNQSLYSISITPRQKDQEFENNIKKIIRKYDLTSESAPEGVIVVENEQCQSIFVTCMEPINGIIQLSLQGIVQRIICQSEIDGLWNMHFIPSFFVKSTQNKNLLMASEGTLLRIIDIEANSDKNGGKIKSNLLFESNHNKPIGDFVFFQQENEESEAMLIVNLQDGIIQFHQYDMFLMLKKLDINAQIVKYKELEGKEIRDAYGITIGPDECIYISDHINDRILRIQILDFDMIRDQNQALDYNKINLDIFVREVKVPNYNKWCDARDIGLNFVTFPNDEAL